MNCPVGKSIVELSEGLQGMDPFTEVVGLKHGPCGCIIILSVLFREASEYRFGAGLEQHDDPVGLHDGAIALVHYDAAASGHHLSLGAGYLFQRPTLDTTEFILAITAEDVLDCHSPGRDYLIIGVHECPSEKSRGLAPDGSLPRARESCDEDVGSGQRTSPLREIWNRQTGSGLSELTKVEGVWGF